MKIQSQKFLKHSILSLSTVLALSSSALADCTYELFNIGSANGTRMSDFIDQLSDECEFSVVVTDSDAQKILNTTLNKTHIKNLTINEVLDLILTQNNLNYTLENNVLKISYLKTKVFSIDYILSQRKGTGSTDVTLSSTSTGTTGSSGTTTSTSSSTGASGSHPSTANSGIKITSTDEVVFWSQLDKELLNVLNRPEDKYIAPDPVINKNAGLITVTATQEQLDRLDKYLAKLQEKVKLQVLIDVQLYTVTMNRSKSIGIDWAQLYKLQNANVQLQYQSDFQSNSQSVTATGVQLTLDQVVKFLKTQGDVSSISNPKVLTLNNQPALITAGTEYFYTIKSTSTAATATGTQGTQTQNDTISSVFAGLLLDITPEISDNDMITLKINPSISETTTDMSTSSSATRTTPPDLNRRQLSSVVTVKDGNKIIMGGLIQTSNNKSGSKIPILGSIPGLSYLFSREENSKQVQELVMVIEPHIIHKDKTNLSLTDLGYQGISDTVLQKGSTPEQIDKANSEIRKKAGTDEY